MRTLGCVACVALCACRFSAPDGVGGETVVDAPPNKPIDAKEFMDAPPEPNKCFGSGLGKLCLSELPTMPKTLTTDIDTSNDASCTQVITVGATLSCVIAGTTVQVPTGTTVRATGNKPLVLVATDTLTIDGTLYVGSPRGMQPGAGASSATCTAPTPPENDTGGSGGGAGGSFAGTGGDGGRGNTNAPGGGANTADPGLHAPALATITALRGGCGGGNGGDGTQNGHGVGGAGGGAVYLIAGSEIHINGRVAAPGAGGSGGANESGGGGGGSGGMIGLDAPAVFVASGAAVTANGGGGGEGCGLSGANRCASGSDGSLDGGRANGGRQMVGDGGNGDGGNGGSSSGNNGGGNPLNGNVGGNDTGAGGGGGGGAGFIYVKGTLSATGATVSPPATPG